ncbi:MAG TPA: hypothetical protein VMF61_15140 [Candidatus Acidoferrales bacterium]|nr:hypothetical protein [Candidatus Acidoferrales bacterium]
MQAKARRAAGTLLCTVAFAATTTAGARAVERIPFTNSGGAVVVEASIDRRPAVPMTVDLSAGVDRLGPSLRSLAYDVDRTFVTMSAAGERIDFGIGRVVSFTIGDFALGDRTVGIAPNAGPADGVVSAAAFRTVATTLDFHAHELVVEDAESFADRRRTGMSVPLILQDDRDLALRLFAWFDFGGRPGLCALDTATDGIVLDKRFAAGAGIAGPALPSVTLRDEPRVAVKGAAVTYADLIYDCEIGNEFWADRALTIDVPNRALWINAPT